GAAGKICARREQGIAVARARKGKRPFAAHWAFRELGSLDQRRDQAISRIQRSFLFRPPPNQAAMVEQSHCVARPAKWFWHAGQIRFPRRDARSPVEGCDHCFRLRSARREEGWRDRGFSWTPSG